MRPVIEVLRGTPMPKRSTPIAKTGRQTSALYASKIIKAGALIA